jgi:hypothetical protein
VGCRCREKKRTTWNQRQAQEAARGHAEQLDNDTLVAAAAAQTEQTQTDNS